MPTPEQDQLIQREEEWYQAILGSDLKKLDEILHPDYRNTVADGTVSTKAADIANFQTKKYAASFPSHVIDEPRVYGNTAVVTGSEECNATFNNVRRSGRYRWTDTWVRDASGSWRCVASHSSKIP
jgi:ketosteroid isomerase-like protein